MKIKICPIIFLTGIWAKIILWYIFFDEGRPNRVNVSMYHVTYSYIFILSCLNILHNSVMRQVAYMEYGIVIK